MDTHGTESGEEPGCLEMTMPNQPHSANSRHAGQWRFVALRLAAVADAGRSAKVWRAVAAPMRGVHSVCVSRTRERTIRNPYYLVINIGYTLG
jgi:hypothetical protein